MTAPTEEGTVELQPCPFCGDDMSSFVPPPHRLARGPGLLYVTCDCGVMGAGGKTVADAIAAWNRRASRSPVVGAVGGEPAERQAQDAKDAARYRWLRDRGVFHDSHGTPSPWPVIGTEHRDSTPCFGAELDAAIDAAMGGIGVSPTGNNEGVRNDE